MIGANPIPQFINGKLIELKQASHLLNNSCDGKTIYKILGSIYTECMPTLSFE